MLMADSHPLLDVPSSTILYAGFLPFVPRDAGTKSVTSLRAHDCTCELDRFLQLRYSPLNKSLYGWLAELKLGLKPRIKHDLCR
jgi:hypothetical protein